MRSRKLEARGWRLDDGGEREIKGEKSKKRRQKSFLRKICRIIITQKGGYGVKVRV